MNVWNEAAGKTAFSLYVLSVMLAEPMQITTVEV